MWRAPPGTAAPVDEELALDGVDEVLELMLAGDWSTEPQPELVGTIEVASRNQRWWVAMASAEVAVEPSGERADARVTSDPSPLLLWLWGRAADGVVEIRGDHQTVARLRKRLALATQ
jgi:hypothetical protein